jgi:hypothetical protein
MDELLAKLSAGQLIGLVAVIMGPLVAIVAVIASQWRRVRIAEMDAALKQQMLDKGMSAAEIEQVFRAGRDLSSGASWPITGVEAVDKTALAQRMVDNGYEAADIERVLKAYEPSKQPGQPLVAKV